MKENYENPKTYKEAINRLEAILEKLEKGEIGIDDLEQVMDEAKMISKYCESKLRDLEGKLNTDQ